MVAFRRQRNDDEQQLGFPDIVVLRRESHAMRSSYVRNKGPGKFIHSVALPFPFGPWIPPRPPTSRNHIVSPHQNSNSVFGVQEMRKVVLVVVWLEIRYATAVAPVAVPEGISLGPADFTCYGVRIPLEFGLERLSRVGVEFFALCNTCLEV